MDAQEALARRLERAAKLMKAREKREREKTEKEKEKDKEKPASEVDKKVAAAAESLLDAKGLAAQKAAQVAAQLAASANPVALASALTVDPMVAASAAAAAMQAKVLAQTGIAVPSYYNPLAVNPVQYAEQMRKRKMLWGNKKEKEETKMNQPIQFETDKGGSSNKWEETAFQDNATQAKFRRLMGIKANESEVPDKDKQVEKRNERFQQMDYEYEVARVKTHTQRSFGLGFGSSFGPPSAPPPSSQPRQEPPK